MGLHKIHPHAGIQNRLRCFGRKKPALLIQYPPATTTIKEFRANLRLDDHNLLSYGRLAQTQHLPRPLKTPFLSDSHDSDESFHRQVELAHVCTCLNSQSTDNASLLRIFSATFVRLSIQPLRYKWHPQCPLGTSHQYPL